MVYTVNLQNVINNEKGTLLLSVLIGNLNLLKFHKAVFHTILK